MECRVARTSGNLALFWGGSLKSASRGGRGRVGENEQAGPGAGDVRNGIPESCSQCDAESRDSCFGQSNSYTYFLLIYTSFSKFWFVL